MMYLITGETAHLDRKCDRTPRPLPHRVHGQGQVPVQAEVNGQQRRDHHPRPQRRGHPQVQDHHWSLQVCTGVLKHHMDYQILSWWQGVLDESAFRIAQCRI